MDGVMDRSFDSMSSFNFSIASTGEMPPVSGQLQRLLCACYHPDKAGPRAKDEDAYAKIVKKKPDESKPGKHENSEKHVPTEVEVDEVGYAKLSIIRTPSQEAQFTSEYENNIDGPCTCIFSPNCFYLWFFEVTISIAQFDPELRALFVRMAPFARS
ncbi:hypothetical protein L596_029230 [Steinernema carpocapsae]|uniref:Uncharacterized protein n=1 Tax=Steinernema carpocapsae TaxID=34508 RepID=A0A4U5LU20_STECR|nr:hypothetical protein L596_029230 [Steinernema carpocapsae]